MKGKIKRFQLVFRHKEDRLGYFENTIFPLAMLFMHSINKYYSAGKADINVIDFWTEATYKIYPTRECGFTTFFRGLTHFTKIEESFFTELTYQERKSYLWERVYQIFKEILPKVKQFDLLEAVEKAYQDGLAVGLNPDFRVLEKDVILYDIHFKASVWMTFNEDNISSFNTPFRQFDGQHLFTEDVISKFTLERDGVVVYERELDTGSMGNEYFLTVYKKIEQIKENTLVIKGHYDMETLPLKIKFTKEDLGLG